MANYKGFDVLDETDVRPWGARDAQQEKDQIDTMVMDCVTNAADVANGHRHYRIWQSDGGAEAVSADADGLITIPEHVGIGVAPNDFIHLHIKDTSVAATAYYMGIYNFHLVDDASGATDATNLFAFYNEFTLNSTGETVGTLKGIYNSVTLTDGSIGSGSDDLYGVDNRVNVVAGTASQNVYGINNSLDFNGGTIAGDIFGVKTLIDIASGVTSVGGNIYGHYIEVDDDDGTATTVYMIYLNEQTGIDWGIYQGGSAGNRLGGDLYMQHDGAVIYGGADDDTSIAHVADIGWEIGGTAGTGLGVGVTPEAGKHLYVKDITLDLTTGYYGIHNMHWKAAGATDASDLFYGQVNEMAMVHNGGTIGKLWAAVNVGQISNGTASDIHGAENRVILNGGTCANAYGTLSRVEAAAAMTSITGNLYGEYIDVDDDEGAAGDVFMLYMNEQNGVTFGIYQNGTAENRFGGVVNAIGGFEDNGVAGVDTTWVNNEGDTVTVSGGIITDVS